MYQQVANPTAEMIQLWEEYMQEPFSDYAPATHFVQLDDNGKIIAGFCVYWDNDNGISGHFVSGWSDRKNVKSVIHVIKYLAGRLGEIRVKTDKRQMKILCEKIGTRIKTAGEFCYYIVKGS